MGFLPSSTAATDDDSGDSITMASLGADPTGASNSRDAIRSAIASAWALRQSTGRRQAVYFGPGRFLVTGKDGLRVFDIAGMDGLSFIGEPGRTVISFEGSAAAGDWYLFHVRSGSSDIEFRGISFDMAGLTSPDPAEQNHLIQIGNGASDVRVIDCSFSNTVGDGIRLFGEFGAEVRDVRIRGCTFTDCGRAGVSFQRWVRGVQLTDFAMYGGTDQQIDFEPTGYGLTADAGGSATSLVDASASFVTWGIEVGDLVVNTSEGVMATVTAVTATTLTLSAGATDWSSDSYYFPKHNSNHLIANGMCRRDGSTGADILITLSGSHNTAVRNVVADGCIQGIDVLYGSIEGCTLDTRQTGVNDSAINLRKLTAGTSIRNNKIICRQTTLAVGRGGISVDYQLRSPEEIEIAGNHILMATRGVGIYVGGEGRFGIRDNRVTLYTPGDSGQSGAISVHAVNGDVTSADLEGNVIENLPGSGTWLYGYQLRADTGRAVKSIRIAGGAVINCTNPLSMSLNGTGTIAPPFIDGIAIDSGASPFVPTTGVMWYQIAGAHGSVTGAGAAYMPRVFWGDGTPEGVLTAPIGSLALRRNGGAGTTLYVKESGTGNTGWIGK